MKKFLLILGLYSLSSTSFAQTWNTDASNIGNSGTALGVSNEESLRFKTNGIEWLSISPTGTYFFNSLSGATDGIFGVTQAGMVYKIDFTGNSNDVLRGDGTFSPLSGNNSWDLNGNVLFSDLTKNVGIGSNIAPEKLTVGGNILTSGNILAAGSISGTSLNVIDIVTSGKEFKISTSLCMKGIDLNTPGSRNEICGMNGPLFIQSETGNDNNTILNYGNNGNVGIGIIPTAGFHVGVKAKFEEDVYMNKIIPNDSIFSIGENTIHFNTYNNTIWGSAVGANGVNGIGFGSPTAFGMGVRSIAIGNRVRADGQNSIIIGQSNQATSAQFRNTIDNSLMIGFNSDLPTMTVLPASGTGTTGKVGIGTSNPHTKLHVHVEADPQIGGYGILSTSNVPTVKSISVIHKDPDNGIDEENFIVYTNGKVYCREVFVKLGQLGDFVFDEDYDLMSYQELKNYLKQNKHLPGVPSEPEVLSGGLNMGEMQAKVLQKTEENTLYILDLNERLEAKEKENEKLKADLEEMKKKQTDLESKMNDILNKK